MFTGDKFLNAFEVLFCFFFSYLFIVYGMRAGERGKTARSRGAHAPGGRNWRSASGSAAAKTHGGSLRRGSGTSAGAAQAERSLPSILFRAPHAPLRKRHKGWTCHFLLWGALLLRYNLFIKSRPVPSLSRESLSDDV